MDKFVLDLVKEKSIFFFFPYCLLLNKLRNKFSGLGIRSFAHPLKSLKTNEQMWVINSSHLGQMSKCEPFTLITHHKRANEQIPRLFWVNRSFFSFVHSLWAKWANLSGRSPGCSEGMSDCERIAQVARQKLANERIAHLFEKIAHFCSCFLQKTSDWLRKKMSEFPTLQILHHAKSLKIINNFFCPFLGYSQNFRGPAKSHKVIFQRTILYLGF